MVQSRTALGKGIVLGLLVAGVLSTVTTPIHPQNSKFSPNTRTHKVLPALSLSLRGGGVDRGFERGKGRGSGRGGARGGFWRGRKRGWSGSGAGGGGYRGREERERNQERKEFMETVAGKPSMTHYTAAGKPKLDSDERRARARQALRRREEGGHVGERREEEEEEEQQNEEDMVPAWKLKGKKRIKQKRGGWALPHSDGDEDSMAGWNQEDGGIAGPLADWEKEDANDASDFDVKELVKDEDGFNDNPDKIDGQQGMSDISLLGEEEGDELISNEGSNLDFSDDDNAQNSANSNKADQEGGEGQDEVGERDLLGEGDSRGKKEGGNGVERSVYLPQLGTHVQERYITQTNFGKFDMVEDGAVDLSKRDQMQHTSPGSLTRVMPTELDLCPVDVNGVSCYLDELKGTLYDSAGEELGILDVKTSEVSVHMPRHHKSPFAAGAPKRPPEAHETQVREDAQDRGAGGIQVRNLGGAENLGGHREDFEEGEEEVPNKMMKRNSKKEINPFDLASDVSDVVLGSSLPTKSESKSESESGEEETGKSKKRREERRKRKREERKRKIKDSRREGGDQGPKRGKKDESESREDRVEDSRCGMEGKKQREGRAGAKKNCRREGETDGGGEVEGRGGDSQDGDLGGSSKEQLRKKQKGGKDEMQQLLDDADDDDEEEEDIIRLRLMKIKMQKALDADKKEKEQEGSKRKKGKRDDGFLTFRNEELPDVMPVAIQALEFIRTIPGMIKSHKPLSVSEMTREKLSREKMRMMAESRGESVFDEESIAGSVLGVGRHLGAGSSILGDDETGFLAGAKFLRSLRKKVRHIEGLEKSRKGGVVLNEAQLKKIESHSQILDTIAQVENGTYVPEGQRPPREWYTDNAEAPGGWGGLDLHPFAHAALKRLGYLKPTPIQNLTVRACLGDFRDIVGVSETGSGKTFAYGLPIVHTIFCERDKAWKSGVGTDMDRLRALIVCPTRELSLQVVAALNSLLSITDHLSSGGRSPSQGGNSARGDRLHVRRSRAIGLVGGISEDKQARMLSYRPAVVVGTPGRLWELMEPSDGYLGQGMKHLRFIVLDEADRLVEKGHFQELRKILLRLPQPRARRFLVKEREGANGFKAGEHEWGWDASGLFDGMGGEEGSVVRQAFVMSATYDVPVLVSKEDANATAGASSNARNSTKYREAKQRPLDKVNMVKMARKLLKMAGKPAVIDVTDRSRPVGQRVKQTIVKCPKEHKDMYILFFLRNNPGRTIIFVNYISILRRLHGILQLLLGSDRVRPLHAAMQQRARLKSLDKFKNHDNGVLIATDVAARGLDIPHVQHVIHFDIPQTPEAYTHRSGRASHQPSAGQGFSVLLADAMNSPKDMDKCRYVTQGSSGIKKIQVHTMQFDGLLQPIQVARRLSDLMMKRKAEGFEKSWKKKAGDAAGVDVSDDDDDPKAMKRNAQRDGEIDRLTDELEEWKERLSTTASGAPRPETGMHGVEGKIVVGGRDQLETLQGDVGVKKDRLMLKASTRRLLGLPGKGGVSYPKRKETARKRRLREKERRREEEEVDMRESLLESIEGPEGDSGLGEGGRGQEDGSIVPGTDESNSQSCHE